jgi:hypothetical protein
MHGVLGRESCLCLGGPALGSVPCPLLCRASGLHRKLGSLWPALALSSRRKHALLTLYTTGAALPPLCSAKQRKLVTFGWLPCPQVSQTSIHAAHEQGHAKCGGRYAAFKTETLEILRRSSMYCGFFLYSSKHLALRPMSCVAPWTLKSCNVMYADDTEPAISLRGQAAGKLAAVAGGTFHTSPRDAQAA